jgi:hypothetical protein
MQTRIQYGIFKLKRLAACGSEGKRGLLGTPQTPAKDSVLCTPDF